MMVDLRNDPIANVILRGIKGDIDVTLENGCLRAAIILIYAGIDTMASLARPAEQPRVERSDFVRWAERYIRFPCKDQLTGLDLYGARCSVLHTYTVDSDISRAGQCRRLGYMDKAVPEVVYNPAIAPDFVLVSVHGLRDAFFSGVDSFLVDAFANAGTAAVVEDRLKALLHELPFKQPEVAGKFEKD